MTGGAGFIGSHLAALLLERGWRVEVIDDLSTGSLENVAALEGHPRFSHTVGSVLDRELMAGLVAGADVIFHLAAAVGVKLVVERPIHTIATNIHATEAVLELAASQGKKVLLASTSEVYGKLDRPSFGEDDDLVLGPTSRARWGYAASKIVDEFLAKAYARERALPIIVVRLFNAIGPRQTGRYGMVVPRFVGQALRGDPITVYGDGHQRRSFTWVGDAVAAMADLVETPAAFGQVVNIGHDQDISILELARLIRDRAQSPSEIRFIAFEDAYETGFDDMPRRLPELDKIRRLIGYRPSLDLAEMIDRILASERHRIRLQDGQPELASRSS